MSKQHLAPDTLYSSGKYAYSQVVVSEPGQQIYIAGQTALDASEKLVGEGDLAAQTEQALHNLELALKAADASRRDLTQIRVYVANYTPDCLEALMPVLHSFWGDLMPPTQTLLGVQSLAFPELLIEIDAVAVRG